MSSPALVPPLLGPVEGASSESAPGSFASAEPVFGLPDLKNYASKAGDEIFQSQLIQLTEIMNWCRMNRSSLEESWREIYRMEMMQFDGNQRYVGRSNEFMPLWTRIHQTIVSSLSRGLFPSDEYMNVQSRDGDPKRSRPIKTYMKYEFDRVAQVRRHIKAFLRQFDAFGNSPLKVWYKQASQSRIKKGGALARDKNGNVRPTWSQVPQLDGLRISARPMFYWYMWPITAETMDDATVIFEDIDVPLASVKGLAREGYFENANEISLQAPPVGHIATQGDILSNSFGLSAPWSAPLSGELGRVPVITECYTFLVFPNDAYMDHEEKGSLLPAQVVFSGNVVLRIARNPFWHQRPPYLFAGQNTTPGSFYGYGSGAMIKPMQFLMNDFVNQTNDCAQYTLNPVVKINPAFLAGPLKPMAPGVVWSLTDVDAGMKFDRPPFELIEAGLQMVQFFESKGQDLTGALPMLQGISAGKGARTATQAQILQKNAMAPLQDIVEDLELSVMLPLMYMTWINAQQYRNDSIMEIIAGESIKVSPEDLIGDYSFEWLASSQAVNQAQRAQQAMQLIQAISPLLPVLTQSGYVVDFVPLINRVFTDGFGFRGFEDFIRPAQAQPGAAPGAMPPPGPQAGGGGAAAEQVDRVRSALEQIAGGLPSPEDIGVGMQPGEGEDFMGVRDNADQLAALNGGNNGKQ